MFPPPRAVYVHVPFCRRRCGYCNFTVLANRADLQQRFLDALQLELTSSLASRPVVDTIFIGGGTPTELTPENLRRLCDMLRGSFALADSYEWSIEANPAGLDATKLDLLRSGGINRLSLGIQSFHSGKLRLLERDHNAADIQASIELARERFPSISLDLIFAVPGESVEIWNQDLSAAIRLLPEHVSTYGLTFDKGALFWSRVARGELQPVDEERQRRMYELAIDRLVAAGWEHYEISNFARPGHHCRHNEVYWAGEPYFAFGPGAARSVDGRRETNHRSTLTYLRRVLAGDSPVAESEQLSPEDRAREQLIFRLRMLAGVSRRSFAKRTGFEIDDLVSEPLTRCVELGLIDDTGARIRLTREGLLLSDAIWPDFL